jgi:hypothetical protein
MNRRGRRLAFTVAATAVVVLLVLAIVHWKTVRDHVQAWHLQLTRETVTIEPRPGLQGMLSLFMGETRDRSWEPLPVSLQRMANYSARPMIFALEDDQPGIRLITGSGELATASSALQPYGLRIVEQRFPRRAYVVIRYEQAPVWINDGGGMQGVAAPQEATPAE